MASRFAFKSFFDRDRTKFFNKTIKDLGIPNLYDDFGCQTKLNSVYYQSNLFTELECIAWQTFRPKKRFERGTLKYSLHKQANASLNSGIDLKEVVKLPPGEDVNDWIAVHVVDFFNRINLLYGTVCENCTEQSCPTMCGGPRYEYHWCDGVNYKKPTALPAPQYITLLMEWVESQINDENLFPVQIGSPFPRNYLSVVKKILKRLFRVFVHVYIHHFDKLVAMGAEAHINTCYKHFYYFVTEYNLIDKKELEPLREMTERICH